jgi:ribosomal protein L37E
MSRVIWKFKSCPRCGGDTFVDRDIGGWYEQCLQCGYCRELKRLRVPKELTSERDEQPTRLARAHSAR